MNDDDSDDYLQPLKPQDPELRWKPGDWIILPIRCDPATNHGMSFKLVTHEEVVRIRDASIQKRIVAEGSGDEDSSSYEPVPNSFPTVPRQDSTNQWMTNVDHQPQMYTNNHGEMPSSSAPAHPQDESLVNNDWQDGTYLGTSGQFPIGQNFGGAEAGMTSTGDFACPQLPMPSNDQREQAENWGYQHDSSGSFRSRGPTLFRARQRRSPPKRRFNKPRYDNMPSASGDLRSVLDIKKQIINTTEEDDDTYLASNSICLKSMKHVLFVDFDNFPRFFTHLKEELPPKTFIWGFYGGQTHFKPPADCPLYEKLVRDNLFHMHPRCGSTKDAADFAICTVAGKLSAQLASHIPFTILSGDKGFTELVRQLSSDRPIRMLNPHDMEINDIHRVIMEASLADHIGF